MAGNETVSGYCDKSSLVDRIFTRLRETERLARTRLENGCAADIAALAGFIEGPLGTAKVEAIEAMMGMGKPSDATLAQSLRLEAFERIGMRCTELVCANANVRFRARFKLYAEEFLEIEALIVDALESDGFVSAKHMLPRIFGVGRLSLDNMLVPEGPSDDSDAEVAAWIERLRRCIHAALLVEIETAQHAVLESGEKRLAVVRVRLSLALRNPVRPGKHYR